MNKQYAQQKPELESVSAEKQLDVRFLVLYNDEVHTFDYVIDSLIEVCELDPIQAEQITFLVHYKGKCDVIKGTEELLMPFKQGLALKGLRAIIN